MKYEIEKCKILNSWLVFERHGNLHFEVHRERTKKACQEWIKSNTKIASK